MDGFIDCLTRGKRSEAACGDEVEVTRTSPGEGVIERRLPRHTVLMRADAFRSKVFAANVTQVFVVIAPRPAFSDELVNRCLVASEAEGVPAVIVVNKSDLADSLPETLARTGPWQDAGYPVLTVCANSDVSHLLPLLAGHTTVLVGQSGMGKSTLMNAVIPSAARRVADISARLDSGRHTTTHAVMHHVESGGLLIDSPGVQAFGLAHLTAAQIEHAFPEFRPFLGRCRFRDCRHGPEPGCKLVDAAYRNEIAGSRLDSFRSLVGEARP